MSAIHLKYDEEFKKNAGKLSFTSLVGRVKDQAEQVKKAAAYL